MLCLIKPASTMGLTMRSTSSCVNWVKTAAASFARATIAFRSAMRCSLGASAARVFGGCCTAGVAVINLPPAGGRVLGLSTEVRLDADKGARGRRAPPLRVVNGVPLSQCSSRARPMLRKAPRATLAAKQRLSHATPAPKPIAPPR